MRYAVTVVLLVLAGAGAFWLGRATGDRATGDGATGDGATGDRAAPTDRGYAAGHADGLLEGRAEQATLNLPASDKTVFDAGYAAGAADVFAGYDGGWDFDAPYVVVLAHGGAGVTYRIASRTPLEPGVDYQLCPDGHTLCRQRR